MSGKAYEVVVVATVEADSPDEAVTFVRAELAMKLGDGGEGLWQTQVPRTLPRWQVSSVRAATRKDEKDGPALKRGERPAGNDLGQSSSRPRSAPRMPASSDCSMRCGRRDWPQSCACYNVASAHCA